MQISITAGNSRKRDAKEAIGNTDDKNKSTEI